MFNPQVGTIINSVIYLYWFGRLPIQMALPPMQPEHLNSDQAMHDSAFAAAPSANRFKLDRWCGWAYSDLSQELQSVYPHHFYPCRKK